MVNLLKAMQEEQQALESNSGERDEIPTPKNPVIRISKKTPELTLRILPGLAMLKGTSTNLGVRQRTIFFDLKTPKRTIENTSLTLPPVYDITNPTEKKVAEWTAEGFDKRLSSKYGFSTISNSYWVNALLLEKSATGDYTPVMNTAGVPQVYAFSIGYSGYNKLVTAAADSDYGIKNAEGELDTFVTLNSSYPVKFGKATQTEFSVQVLSNKELPPLTEYIQALAPQLDDFENVIQPTDVSQPHWFESVKFFIDGEEGDAPSTQASSVDNSMNFNNPFAGIDETDNSEPGLSVTNLGGNVPDPFNLNANTPKAPVANTADTSAPTQSSKPTPAQSPAGGIDLDQMMKGILGN